MSQARPAQLKVLKLVFETPPANTLPVRGDFGKVKQVLINLVATALKFTDEGSITVRPELHERRALDVRDRGYRHRYPKDRQGVIFEKFMQADGSTTRRTRHRSRPRNHASLVELMGGVIVSRARSGTRMYFSLPIWRGGESCRPRRIRRVAAALI
jgi:signal transduction histidine kinase